MGGIIFLCGLYLLAIVLAFLGWVDVYRKIYTTPKPVNHNEGLVKKNKQLLNELKKVKKELKKERSRNEGSKVELDKILTKYFVTAERQERFQHEFQHYELAVRCQKELMEDGWGDVDIITIKCFE